MTTLLIFIIILIVIFLTILRLKKTAFLMLLIVLVSYFMVGSGILSALLLPKLQDPFISNQNVHWKDKNVLVLLGNGTVKLPDGYGVKAAILAYSRIVQAAQSYVDCVKSGNQCLVIISGGENSHTGVSEAVLYRDILQTLGVKPSDMQLEAKSLNTFENAEFTAELLKNIPHDEVVLVTSAYHLKRALLYFSYFGIEAKSIPSDYLQSFLAIIPSSYNFVLADLVLHEYIGIMRFYVYNFLGWNKRV